MDSISIAEVTGMHSPIIFYLMNILNPVLAIISLFLICIAIKKYNIKKIFSKWLIMYLISKMTATIINNTIYNKPVGYWSPMLNSITIVTIIIRIIMVIYPIIKIKKRNKNLKGEKNNA